MESFNVVVQMAQFKSALKKSTGIVLDFRVHKYTANHFGLGGIISADFAGRVISFLYDYCGCSGSRCFLSDVCQLSTVSLRLTILDCLHTRAGFKS